MGRVPEPDRVVPATGGEGLPVGAERYRIDSVRRAGQLLDPDGMGGISDVPKPDVAVWAADGEGLSVRAERHREDVVGGLADGPSDYGGVSRAGHVPQCDVAVKGAGGQGAPV